MVVRILRNPGLWLNIRLIEANVIIDSVEGENLIRELQQLSRA